MISMLLAASAAHLMQAEAPAWRDANVDTSAINDEAGLAQLARDFPNSATIQRRILIQAFQAGDRDRALAALERLRAMGYGLSAGAFGQIGGLIGDDEGARLLAAAEWTRQPIGSSDVAATTPVSLQLGEGAVIDPAGNSRLFVGSVVGRQLWSASGGNELQPLAISGLGSVFGLAVDAERRLLWLASGKVDQTPDADEAFVGLVAINMDSLTETARFAAPNGARSLNDIGIGPDGAVYAADAIGGGIYRLAEGGAAIEQLIAPNRLRGPQGIAIAADNSRAYLADYGYGIAMLDFATGELQRLGGDHNVMLDGVDGLYWSEGALVAIHNGIRPMRISRLDLDEAGTTVVQQVTLERANAGWGEPTLGQVIGDQFMYVSNPQWERFGDGGELRGEAPLQPNVIRTISIR